MKLKSMVFVGLVGIAQLTTGCAIDTGAESGSETELGTVEMQLQTTSPTGTVYRLRNAVFTVTNASGAVVATLNSELEPAAVVSLGADLGIGNYTISLGTGWSVERDGQVSTALLTSAQSQTFTINANAVTRITYAFKIEGQPITLGGTLNVGIAVGECSADPWEPNNTRETAASLASESIPGSVCGDDDWFTFAVGVDPGTPLALSLDFVHAHGDLDLELIQPDMTTLRSEGVTSQERIAFVSQAGNYFARVHGYQQAVGDYQLTLSVDDATQP